MSPDTAFKIINTLPAEPHTSYTTPSIFKILMRIGINSTYVIKSGTTSPNPNPIHFFR